MILCTSVGTVLKTMWRNVWTLLSLLPTVTSGLHDQNKMIFVEVLVLLKNEGPTDNFDSIAAIYDICHCNSVVITRLTLAVFNLKLSKDMGLWLWKLLKLSTGWSDSRIYVTWKRASETSECNNILGIYITSSLHNSSNAFCIASKSVKFSTVSNDVEDVASPMDVAILVEWILFPLQLNLITTRRQSPSCFLPPRKLFYS